MMLRPVPGAAGGDGQPWGENGVEFGLVNNFKLIFNWGGKMEMIFVILRFPLFPAWNVAQFGRDGVQVRL